jgi:hypothetical protein
MAWTADAACPAGGTLLDMLSRLSMALHRPRPACRTPRLCSAPAPLRRQRSAGFLLPLTALLSLLLLLGSLSVQAVSLQGRLRGDSERQMQTSEDQLASAAQLLVARLQERHPCLLPLALEQWAGAGCASASDLAQLRRGEVFDTGWQLLRWQPGPSPRGTAEPAQQRLTLEIALEARGRAPRRRAGFELRLTGMPWRVLELRPLGLRGEAL